MRFISGTWFAALALVLGVLVAPSGAAEVPPTTPPTAPPATPPTPPTVVETKTIGKSVKGRPIRAYRIGEPTSQRKVVLLSTMHGDERGTSKILLNLVKGSRVTGADIWVIPYLNRDGYARDIRKNARGVDLNRNFPTGWKRQGGKYYSGRKKASEPETRALMRFLGAVDPDFVVSLHQPLRGVDISSGKTRALGLRLAKGLKLPRKTFRCNTGCHGTMTQWFNKHHRGAALTVEYGSKVSRNQYRVTGPRGLLAAVFATR